MYQLIKFILTYSVNVSCITQYVWFLFKPSMLIDCFTMLLLDLNTT